MSPKSSVPQAASFVSQVLMSDTSKRSYSASGRQHAPLFKPKDRGAMHSKNNCRLPQWHKPIGLGRGWSLLDSFEGLDDLGYLSGNGVFDGGLDSLRNWIAHSDTP
jgi:hypothetical protein